MKRLFKFLSFVFIFILVFSTNITETFSAQPTKSMTILFTHDLHDNFYPFDIEQEGKIHSMGGYARLYSAIKRERLKDPQLLLVDAGDFSMGTLFQTIFSTHAPQLRIMGKMGYDFTTFGNHEFDFRADGLAHSLNAAKKSKDKLPQIVASNTSFPKDEQGNLTPTLIELRQAMDDYGVKDYAIIQRNNVKIGIFGLMGPDAASNAPMSEVVFTDTIESSKEIVDILKNKEKVDLIICLSHSGTWEKKSKSEDEILAGKVPEIDIIISGHTHTKLEKPIIVGNTIIGSYRRYGENLGIMKVSQNSDNRWDIDDYELLPIDSTIPMDSGISDTIEEYKNIVQKQYLDRFNLGFNEILAQSSFSFTSSTILGDEHTEEALGNIIGDSYLYAVKKAEGHNYEPVAAAIVPYGTIRDSFVKGNITVADVFRVSSLGIGPDKISGYPLISVYLTGKELKTAAEVDASIQPIMDVAQLYISGLSYTFNPKRMIFNKVTNVVLQDMDGNTEEIDDDKLYRIVAGLYSAQMLSIVGDQSFGLLSIVPKTKEGLPITDFEAHIIYDGDLEVKEWLALAMYLQSFDKKNTISQLPLYYSQTQGRKIVDSNSNIIARVKSPNKISLAIYSIILLIIAVITFIIRFCIRRKRRRRYLFSKY